MFNWKTLNLDLGSEFFVDLSIYKIQSYSDVSKEWIDSEIDNPFILMTEISKGASKYRYRYV